jgi:hypothetical protein
VHVRVDPTYFPCRPIGYQRLDTWDSLHPHNLVLHPHQTNTESWISEDLLTLYTIDEPVKSGENLKIITADMFTSPDQYDSDIFDNASSQLVPSFPSLNFHDSIYFDEPVDSQPISHQHESSTQYFDEPVTTCPAMSQFEPMKFASDIFDIQPEREITLEEEIEQLECPFIDDDLHYVFIGIVHVNPRKPGIPRTLTEAKRLPDAPKWLGAFDTEIQSVERQETFIWVPKPSGVHIH